MKNQFPLFATLALTALLTRVSPAQTIYDNFTDPTNWGPPYSTPGKNLSIANGRMDYTSTSIDNGGAFISRNAPLLPTTQSWSLKVDVHVDPFTITAPGQYTDVFLGVGKTADPINTHVTFEFDRGWWHAGSSYFSDPTWTNFPSRFYRLRWP